MKYSFILFFAYLLIKFDQTYTHVLGNWIYFYVPDLLCLPVLLGVIHFILSKLTSKFTTFSFKHILFSASYVAVVFEFILPHFANTYTSDWLDVLMYFIGAISYYIITIKNRTKLTHAQPSAYL